MLKKVWLNNEDGVVLYNEPLDEYRDQYTELVPYSAYEQLVENFKTFIVEAKNHNYRGGEAWLIERCNAASDKLNE